MADPESQPTGVITDAWYGDEDTMIVLARSFTTLAETDLNGRGPRVQYAVDMALIAMCERIQRIAQDDQ
jgi:hypothetical protein